MHICNGRNEPLALQVKFDYHGCDDRQSSAIVYLYHLRCQIPTE